MSSATIPMSISIVIGAFMNVGCTTISNKETLAIVKTDTLTEVRNVTVSTDTTYKVFGLDSFYASAGKTELRIKVTRYPWLEDKLVQIKISPTDSTVTIFRYHFAEEVAKRSYDSLKVIPKISWQAIADSLSRFDLLSLPEQRKSSAGSVTDGQYFAIGFTDRGRLIQRHYENPGMYADSADAKVIAFLNFIDRAIGPVVFNDTPK